MTTGRSSVSVTLDDARVSRRRSADRAQSHESLESHEDCRLHQASPDPRVAAPHERGGDVDPRAGRQLRVERARRLRAGRGAAAAREAQRGSRRVRRGPARVQQVIREALARGADRAIHVEDDSLASADASITSAALASAMTDERFDLVLTGLQSDDQGHAQVGVMLAERLQIPHSTIIMEVQVRRRPPSRQARARGRMVPVDRHATAGAADDSERHQPASLRDAERASWPRRRRRSARYRCLAGWRRRSRSWRWRSRRAASRPR